MLFGQPIETGFNLARERRKDQVGWAVIAGAILCAAYDFAGGPFSVEIFQILVATVLCYGASFYVDHLDDFSEPWVWKAAAASLPLHALYLSVFLLSDRTFPNIMTKAVAFIPVLAVGFGIESVLLSAIIARFRPKAAD
jgi:uncharacterized membrane protein YccC